MTDCIKTKALFPECLKEEGFIRYDGYPVAYIKNDLSVQLLLPFSELRNRPYYSSAFNGFIEIHHSESLLSARFMLALIAEWGSFFFGAPEDENRSEYLRAAIKRLFGLYSGEANLARALNNPQSDNHPLAHSLTKEEQERVSERSSKNRPLYIINSLWSGRFLTQGLQSEPIREAKLPVTIDTKHVRVTTDRELFIKVITSSSQKKFMGNCVRRVNAQGLVEHSWLLPRQRWRWFMFEPGQTYFLSENDMWYFLPQNQVQDRDQKTLDEVLTKLSVSQDPTMTCSDLEDVLKLLAELEHENKAPDFRTPILEQLLVEKEPLPSVLETIEARSNGRHANLEVNPAGLILACASKAPEFQGQRQISGNRYCPMPEIDHLAQINHPEK